MRRGESFLMRQVGDLTLLVPLSAQVVEMNGAVILNETAQCIWEFLAEDRSLDELSTALAERFDVDAGRARGDAERFLSEITRMGMTKE